MPNDLAMQSESNYFHFLHIVLNGGPPPLPLPTNIHRDVYLAQYKGMLTHVHLDIDCRILIGISNFSLTRLCDPVISLFAYMYF